MSGEAGRFWFEPKAVWSRRTGGAVSADLGARLSPSIGVYVSGNISPSDTVLGIGARVTF